MTAHSTEQPGPRSAQRDHAACPLLLLIDEDPLLLRALARILRGEGYLVAAATSPTEIELALSDPDLAVVVLDREARALDALGCLAQIKRERPAVEVVVTTARPGIEDAIRCMRRGALDYVSKPFGDLERLRGALARALRRRPPTPATEARVPDQVCRDIPRSSHAFPNDGRPPVAPDCNAARGCWSVHPLAAPSLPVSLDAYEKLALERALAQCGGEASRAAALLGIGRSTFYRKAAKHGLLLQRQSGVGAGRRGERGRSRGRGVGRPGPIG